MTVLVRDFRPADAKAVAELQRAALPFMIFTPQGIAWQAADSLPDEHLRMFVAELDGRIVGSVSSRLLCESSTPGQGAATPKVHPDHRRRGVGAALLTAAEEHLTAVGATHVFAWALDEPGPLAFAERHGYRRTRPAHCLRLDLTTADLPTPPAPLPPGVRLLTAADFGADPHPLFAADAETIADEPGDVPTDALTYDSWLRTTWEHPDIDLDLTCVVTVDDTVAAYSWAASDNLGRYSSVGTGTSPAFRGRGLARLAKAHSLHRARDAGCTVAFTGNDATNAPMLAINRSFGYRPFLGEWRCVRELGQG
ncbi:GNAT family N-acetyltransferase [Streptomyces gilvosporeus]|uniref:GNAT family N-acetyltransferase n=1 Tax=Streptomyces gilvosporeus TaxID=553510 RepID=A0A1V0TP59_9ACTN|nr:GNAT family N-acetyltransferase [Streptomyces gilvosporeus]ARF54600.1 GNAT family N-acetyltransferase [Streptomyces gilvosporeus]